MVTTVKLHCGLELNQSVGMINKYKSTAGKS